MIYELSYLILLLPLLSFIVLGLAGMKMQHKTAGIIGTCSLSLVTILSYWTAFTYFTADRTAEGVFQTIVPFNFTWLPLGNLHFDMGILLDPISVMMLIVISTVSLMVHIYSFGYNLNTRHRFGNIEAAARSSRCRYCEIERGDFPVTDTSVKVRCRF